MKKKKQSIYDLDEVVKALYLFASGMTMAVDEFNERMSQIKTGERNVQGNGAVPLGRIKTRRD